MPSLAARFKIALTMVALAAAVAIASVLVLRFADTERAHDLRAWQARLGLVADSRQAAVDGWLEAQSAEVRHLAENTALQIYMTELAAAPAAQRASESLAQSGYLRNLLSAIADRAGFTAKPAAPAIDANVRRAGVAGLILADMKLGVVAASDEAPPLSGRIGEFAQGLKPGVPALLDIHLGAGGVPAMGFAAPIFAVQGDAANAEQVGWVIGVKEVARELYALLVQPGAAWQSGEAVLVRRADAGIEYLSPTKDTAPLQLRESVDAGSAAGFALANPGGFAIRRDQRDVAVLVAARRIAGAPWALMYKIDRAEALSDSDARITRLMFYLFGASLIVLGAAAALWRHGASVRATAAAAEARRHADEAERQRALLALVTDSQPGPIYILDHDGRYRFANLAAAASAGMNAADMLGKFMANVAGPDAARRRQQNCALAPITTTERSEADGKIAIAQVKHVPVPASGSNPPGVLVIEQDITDAIVERERHERTLREITRALVSVVDRRDPNAANHSNRVAVVAGAIARAMGLDATTVETAETAGRLMNIGKIVVPEALLTRAGRLQDDEVRLIRDSLQASADLLDGIAFQGPVVETLRQLQERWDGGGRPRGLAGEDILPSARIVQVANAFVALASPRAYRAAESPERAAQALVAEGGKAFDMKAVAALLHLVENRAAELGFLDARAAE